MKGCGLVLKRSLFSFCAAAVLLAGCGDISPTEDEGTVYHSLTITFSGMAEYLDEPIKVRVIQVADNQEVKREEDNMVTGSSFEIFFGDILEENESYNVELYIDLDSNNRPDWPIDPSWQLSLPSVSGDRELQFSPQTQQKRQIDWPVN